MSRTHGQRNYDKEDRNDCHFDSNAASMLLNAFVYGHHVGAFVNLIIVFVE